MDNLQTENITLQVADGTSMNAYVATPADGGQLPGLLVFQEAYGVNPHIRDVTERFAKKGYVAIAPELFHRTAPGFQCEYTNFAACMPHMQALTAEGIVADATAAFDWLQKNSRVSPNSTACVGFCMGGRASFLANSALPLKAAISFYGGGIAPTLLPRAFQQHGPILHVRRQSASEVRRDQYTPRPGDKRLFSKTATVHLCSGHSKEEVASGDHVRIDRVGTDSLGRRRNEGSGKDLRECGIFGCRPRFFL